MKYLIGFARSMAGRMFLILVIGMTASVATALLVAAHNRNVELERLHLERATDRAANFLEMLYTGSDAMKRAISVVGLPGVRLAREDAVGDGDDPALTNLLQQRLGAEAKVVARHAPIEACRRRSGVRASLSPEVATELRAMMDARDRQGELSPSVECWLVEVVQANGQTTKIALDMPQRRLLGAGDAGRFDPIFVIILILGAAVIAYFTSRRATEPLNRLALAAEGLGASLDSPPVLEVGTSEMKAAARAFNAMQERLRRNVSERHQMLAAITHDLQTPMTRLRLRLEKVEDEELRERLVSDLSAMQGLIREGLDLVKSAETTEPHATVDLDALIESLVEDEADAGRPTTFIRGCKCDVRVRPGALSRTLMNLIDNAIKYGGSAEVSADKVGDKAVIRVRDHGPGLPEDQLEAVFDPMVRLETSRSRETGGVGIGLTIARALAHKNGGTLTLRNHPDGGAEAVLILPAG